jgi:F-type H+-transporting ATPase subunit gamma
VIGAKASSFFGSMGGRNYRRAARPRRRAAKADDLIGGVKVMLDAYASGNIDRLFIASATPS